MKQVLLLALVATLALALVYGHPLEDPEQRLTLEDADAQPVNDEGAGVRAARHFGGGFGGFGGRGGGGFCCGGGGGGYRRGGFGGGGYPGGGFGGGYPGGGGGYGGGSASASASASASSNYYG
ncbi:glycine-rich cell wall structural protein [Drosophila guanche]|uniref:Uncharacterized protein n=1 Tax=Drosophila guanche TaxID=7266 RepID=A0A3B0JPI0_DROGU|nr:glycine-rich cell wall structural protein [Drosophila guanche]SPP74571.1 Hypothetical predicted protein [Drosophila guanche]